MKYLYLLSLLLLSQPPIVSATGKRKTEISDQERNQLAIASLKSKPQSLQVYARGLVCESCAIGIRKKVQRLNFVDTSKEKKGVTLSAESQLVSISILPGKVADFSAIAKAIKGAGYDPIKLYHLSSGAPKAHTFIK